MNALAALLFFGAAIFALTVMTMMMSEYWDRMVAALTFEPMPRQQRYRAGQPIGGRA